MTTTLGKGHDQNSVCSVWTFQKLQTPTLPNNLIISWFWSLKNWDFIANIDTKGTTTKNALKCLIGKK